MKIKELKTEILKKLEKVNSIKELVDIKVLYMGKKGRVTELSKNMRDMDKEEKKTFGMALNDLRNIIEDKIEEKRINFEKEEMNKKLEDDKLDVSLSSTKINVGNMHPMTKIVTKIEELFISMGYNVVSGPEIELVLYNFEKLNVPKEHPARDPQDSFYITEDILLRAQTSPVQIRTMEKSKGPIRILSPGKVYRRDTDDATHSHQFMQIEGLVVDENITIAHLKGTLEEFVWNMFGVDRKIRFRPSYFPFTEPSLEVDISCFKCGGKGCNICKKTGWIEVLGAGMVHPNVLEMSGYDSKKYTGFAFGIGVERIAMLKYGITNIRDLYTNDLRFIKQFDGIEGEYNESK